MLRNILILLLVCKALVAFATFDITDNCIKAHQAMLRLQLNEAGILISREKAARPENQLAIVLENNIAFLKAILSEDQKEIAAMGALAKRSIEIIEKSDKADAYRRPALAQIHLQMAYIDARFGSYLSPSLEIGRAYRLLDLNHDQFPQFKAGDPQTGLLHILIGSIPSEYRWLPDLLQMEGSVKQGQAEIFASIENRTGDKILSLIAPECLLMLSLIAVQVADEEIMQLQVLKLFSESKFDLITSQSPLLLYAQATLLMKLGRNDEAITLLSNCQFNTGQYPFPVLDYYLGIAKLNRLDKDANKILLGFTSTFKGKNLINSAYQKLAWYYLLQGDKANYVSYMERIQSNGEQNTESDKKAYQDAISGREPNVDLLKSRLLFDGGYYQRASEQLSRFNPSKAGIPAHDYLEYYYRKARILHKMDKYDEALAYYIIVLNQGSNSTFYFAANSALNMGEIYESRHQKEKAKTSYEKCLSLKYTEYKNGISMKARARLNLMKKSTN
ncbi:MAG: tetratricopeptide repeat protein [Bacteroidales bacterium]